MRTTLDLDDTVLAAARSLARAEKLSLGAAVSKLALRGLREDRTTDLQADFAYSPFPLLIGDPDFPVTPDLVNAHRDDNA
jgi:hypothetical protein